MAKFKCPQCGNEDKEKFQARALGAGMWHVRCFSCHCDSTRFAPVGNLASTREVIEWIESEDSK